MIALADSLRHVKLGWEGILNNMLLVDDVRMVQKKVSDEQAAQKEVEDELEKFSFCARRNGCKLERIGRNAGGFQRGGAILEAGRRAHDNGKVGLEKIFT